MEVVESSSEDSDDSSTEDSQNDITHPMYP